MRNTFKRYANIDIRKDNVAVLYNATETSPTQHTHKFLEPKVNEIINKERPFFIYSSNTYFLNDLKIKLIENDYLIISEPLFAFKYFENIPIKRKIAFVFNEAADTKDYVYNVLLKLIDSNAWNFNITFRFIFDEVNLSTKFNWIIDHILDSLDNSFKLLVTCNTLNELFDFYNLTINRLLNTFVLISFLKKTYTRDILTDYVLEHCSKEIKLSNKKDSIILISNGLSQKVNYLKFK